MIVFAPGQCLSLLIHAGSKQGKSTLSSTAPAPILVLDAEDSWRFIPVRKRFWDPEQEKMPPQYDGTWDVCLVKVTKWSTVETTYNLLRAYPNVFTSVVIDSITEIQRRCAAHMKLPDGVADGTAIVNIKQASAMQMKIQEWGTLLGVMDAVIRGFRDFTMQPNCSIRCVVFISETKQRPSDNKWVPHLRGQLGASLPYFVDICGYLYPVALNDENGQPTISIRQLWMGPSPYYETGSRVLQQLGHYQNITLPTNGGVGTDITRWMQHIFNVTEEGN